MTLEQDLRDASDDLETTEGDGKRELRLWLRILACTNLIEAQVRARLRDRFNTTLPQFDLMAQLDRGPEEGLSMGALGERMMVSAGNVTGITDRLEREGHVERVRSTKDRRSQYVRLTPKGRREFATMAREHESWITAMFQKMKGDEQERLFEHLARLKRSVTSTQNGEGPDHD